MVKRKVSSLAVVVFALGCLVSPTAWGLQRCSDSTNCQSGQHCVWSYCVAVNPDSEKEADLHSHYEKDAQESQ